MQQDETRPGLWQRRVEQIQGTQLLAGHDEQWPVCFQRSRIGIGPVAQQGKLGARLGVGQIVQMQPVHQFLDRRGVRQHAGNNHHHPVFRSDAARQRQTRKVFGPGRFTDQAVDQRHHGF